MTARSLPEDGVERLTLRDHFAIIALKELITIYPAETAEKKALEDSMMRQRNRVASGLP
jgi:hypothetical protein